MHCRLLITIYACLLTTVSSNCVTAQQSSTRDKNISRSQDAHNLLPDLETRRTVKSILTKDVTKITVFGPDFDCWEYNPIEVRDKHLIGQFLVALKQAKAPYLGTADRADTLLIYTASMKNGDYPLRFDFNPKNPTGCFGVEFYNVVRKIHFKHGTIALRST